jgi:hypothetical protein
MMSPEGFGLKFHHLGLAVPDRTAAGMFLRGQGYSEGATVHDPLQSADLAMWRHDVGPWIEVIAPAWGDGPVADILAVKPEGLVYHLCYTTADLDSSLDRLEQAGLRVFEVSARKPAVLFGGAFVSFHLVLGVGLIEIIEGSGACVA